jgi:hypothetical protein
LEGNVQQTPIFSRIKPVEKAAVLHLGTIKTGTTYIQSLARKNACRLADQGVVYPTCDDSSAHHLFAEQIGGEPASANAILDQHIDAGAGQHLLLSSEIFISHPAEHLEQLRGFVRSWLQEAIKHGWGGGFSGPRYSDRLNNLARNPYSHVMLQSVEIAQKVVDVFGPDRTIFVAFDNILNSADDLFDHFLNRVIGIDNYRVDHAPGDRNVSIDFKTQETARLLNTIINLRGRKSDIRHFIFLIEKIDELFGEFPEFDSLENYRRSITSNSREGANGEMERELFQRFGDQFLNARGCGDIYSLEYERQIESADLLAFSSNNLRAFEALERLADEAIGKLQPVATQAH